MPIPVNPLFEEFLAGVTLGHAPIGDAHVTERFLQFAGTLWLGAESFNPNLRIFFATHGTLQWQSVVAAVSGLLRRSGHPASTDIATALLAMVAAHNVSSRVPLLNDILASGLRCDVYQLAALLGCRSEANDVTFGTFRVGIFGRGSLHRLAGETPREALPSDGDTVFERSSFAFPLISSSILSGSQIGLVATRTIYHAYIAAIAEELFSSFWTVLRDSQTIPVALGAPAIDDEAIQYSANLRQVTLLSSPVGEDWVFVQSASAPRIDVDAVRQLELLERALLAAGHQLSGGTSELDSTVLTYARFVAKAEQHRQRMRLNEAFLHFVIGLDLLLGTQETSTASVSSRAAIIVAGARRLSYKEQEQKLREYYNLRSRYVHSGQLIEDRALDGIRDTCQEILHALIRLRGRTQESEAAVLPGWHKRLDYLVKAAEINKLVPMSDYAECGIAVRPVPSSAS